jgi:hypothetical protein
MFERIEQKRFRYLIISVHNTNVSYKRITIIVNNLDNIRAIIIEDVDNIFTKII